MEEAKMNRMGLCLLNFANRLYSYFSIAKNQFGGVHDRNMQGTQDVTFVELFDQDANDYVDNLLSKGAPCMIAKFGTIELNYLTQFRIIKEGGYKGDEIKRFIRGKLPKIDMDDAIDRLIRNAGFFPRDLSLGNKFYKEYLWAMRQVDVLGSYRPYESVFNIEMPSAKRINIDGYLSPYFWNNPWTRHLKGKKVLVVHPFAEDIQKQYTENKNRIWKDPDLLPEFELITYKAVQSILGIKTEFSSWFDALQKMKDDISNIDYDVALIGCGAYGMPLTAHCKTMGKQAIHMAGSLQILFGVIGTRWENNPKVAPMINEYWVRPSVQNVPKNAKKIENACYW